MRNCIFFRGKYIAELFVIFLLFTLNSCSTLVAPLTHTISPTPNRAAPFTSNDGIAAPNIYHNFDIPDVLHIQGDFGCTPQPNAVGSALVLSANRFTYDSHEIQQMSAYLDNPSQIPLPDTLQFVSGGFLTPSSLDDFAGCGGIWELTNLGNTTIQISNMVLRLTADSQPNLQQYNLINVCSIGSSQKRNTHNPYHCIPSGGTINGAVYSFLLRPGKGNTEFQPTPPSSKVVSIDPGKAMILLMHVESPVPDGSQIYSVIPVLTVNTIGRQITYELQQLVGILTFAKDSQFSCYQLQGDTFRSQQVQVKGAPSSRCL